MSKILTLSESHFALKIIFAQGGFKSPFSNKAACRLCVYKARTMPLPPIVPNPAFGMNLSNDGRNHSFSPSASIYCKP